MMGNIEALRKGIVQIEDKRKTKLQDRLHEIMKNPNKIYDNDSAFSEISDKTDVSISDFLDQEMQDLEEMENISPYDFMEKRK